MASRRILLCTGTLVIIFSVLSNVPGFAQPAPSLAKNSTILQPTAHWTAPTEGAPVARYLMEIQINDGDFELLANDIPGNVTFYAFDVNCGETVVVRVAGISETGVQGPFSLPSEPWYADCDTLALGMPRRPGIIFTDVTNRQATAFWYEPEGGAPVASYLIEIKRNDGEFELLTDRVPAETRFYIFTVNCGDTYVIRVAAVSDTGEVGPFSEPSDPWYANCDVSNLGVPGKPHLAFDDTLRQARASWTAPGTGDPVDHYLLQMSTDGGATFDVLTDDVPGTETTYIFPVECFSTIVLRVAGVSASGQQGSFSDLSDSWYADCDALPPGEPGQPKAAR